ncbi:type 1 glutamine amidotransferase-like domain-containing protein [Candidatus Gracilibacteria bacterium]|nr:type 1 glutamine amidotransferase-like domain-containing protein [Candidatus Gracilibacteria bacterium]
MDAPRVAVIPTASGLEHGMPERWNALGEAHFRELGATVTPIRLITRMDAADTELVERLRNQHLYYFSGGSPDYIIETLHETSAWTTIANAHRAGAIIAGCSAGAMMLGGYTVSVRRILAGEPPRWRQALGLVPGLAIMPHFDRSRQFMSADRFAELLQSAPCGITMVGIDEETALVRLPHASRWSVTGRRTVSVFGDDGRAHVYRAGDTIDLS